LKRHMPTYRFRDKDTGLEFDKFMSISSRDDYLKTNPNYEQVIQGTMLGDSIRLGVRKNDSGFNEVLSRINSANPRSNLKDKLSRS
jgi:predicted nucleic acid-binding Zn ribbon protein